MSTRPAAAVVLLAGVLLAPGCDGCRGGPDGGQGADSAASDGAALSDAGSPSDAGADAGSVGDGGPVPVPDLAPIAAAEVPALAAYVRNLRVISEGSGPRSMAWSMVNISCQDRAMALEYAFAAAEAPLDSEPPPMTDTDLTLARIEELAANPTYEVATINITGPLIAEQALIDPGGTPLVGPPQYRAWSYHHGVVINVDGELRVVDLSVGDDPLPIDEWAHSFVDPATPCYLMHEDEYWVVWDYWLAVYIAWEPPERPPRVCGYTITPIFAFRWDQTPADLASFIASAPGTMIVQLEGFETILTNEYGASFSELDIPDILSVYTPQPEATLCIWLGDLPYCDTI